MGPSAAILMCPTSPAMSFVPLYNSPSSISPAPMPVPNVKNIMLRSPFPAPNFHSASAQAFASFCKYASNPNRSSIMSTIGTHSQSGRFGGARITPRLLSSGPPQLIPAQRISSGERAFFFIISSTLSSSSSVTARQPRPTRVSKRSLSIIISSASPCALPSRTAHFVPPMSIPIIYFFILYQITSDFTAHILYT